MKSATIYKRKGKMYFHSLSRTTAGVWIATEPFMSIETSEQPSVKGNCVKEALTSSREGVKHPEVWGLFKPILTLAGVRSWSAFAKSALCCSVEFENNELKFVPYKNSGPREGYDPIPEQTIVIPYDAPSETIGSILEQAFSACE